MNISKLTTSILKYLLLFTVMMVVVTGLFIAKDLHQAGLKFQDKAPKQVVLTIPGGTGSCTLPNVYTSLPAKCKTADGKFAQGTWSSPNIMVPELK